MTDEEYFALEALSASGAKLLRKSPLHYKSDRERKRVPTAAMIFGTAVHKLALEPDTQAFAVKKTNWASKEGKEEKARLEASGLPILSEADAERALAIRDALHADKRIAALLDGAVKEKPNVWNQYDVLCKAKADAVKGDTILDLKTCIDASPAGFQKSVAAFSYHLQAAHYMAGFEASDFVFICVESQAPHATALYRLDKATLTAGALEMKRAAEIYRRCLQTNDWPGYDANVGTLTLPRWAMPQDEWGDAA